METTMPNIYTFIKNEMWGKALTFLSVLVIVSGVGSFIYAQGVKASNIENGIEDVHADVEKMKATIPTTKQLTDTYVTRPEWDKINEEREKRFTEAKEAIERSVEQMRTEQREFQMEQRAVNRQILQRLPNQ